MPYDFKLNYNTAEATKNICTKGESTVDPSTVKNSVELQEPQQLGKVRYCRF